MVASGQQRMPLRQEDQKFTVQASLHGIKTHHQLHQLHVTDEGLRPKRFYFLLNFLTF